MSDRPLRVVQWTTGKVATQSIKAILDRPELELVGLYAFSKEKVGRDVGDLIGLKRQIGVKATNDIGALLELRPDCIVYMPLHPNVDEMARLLRAGVNIVTTASFITGRGYGEAARKHTLFWINHTPKPMKLKCEFKAVVEGTRMSGKMKAGFMGSYAFSAEKL